MEIINKPTIVGIDFSINSPSLCFLRDGKYKFVSFYNSWGKKFDDKKIVKDLIIPKELNDLDDCYVKLYKRDKASAIYSTTETNKLNNAISIANEIIEVIKKETRYSDYHIAIEGFSFGSKGNSFIDLIFFNSILRSYISTKLDAKSFLVFSPSHIKKTVGKGNANKVDMLKGFLSNVLDDDSLKNSSFYKWCTANKDRYLINDKISKPLDDLVDAYTVLQTLKLQLKSDLKVYSPLEKT